MRLGTQAEVATQESLNTAFGVGRVVRYAAAVGAAAEGGSGIAVHQQAATRCRAADRQHASELFEHAASASLNLSPVAPLF
jgi:hypothetical protein